MTLTKDESQIVLQGNVFHVGKDNQHLTGVIKSKLIQMYGDFEGFPLIILHRLGWCHIMTPV